MLVGRSGLSPVMVGRAPELDRVARLVGAASGPSVALVGGEAGVGKTRLIQELLARVAPGTCVLVGQADPGALGRPFELLLDAVDGKADDHADLVAQVTDAARTSDERVRAAFALIRRLTGDGPAVIVFDDLHWADSESVALFERLAEPDGGRLLLVGTYRPDSLTRRHPVADLLPRLERRHSVTHVRLDRLTAGDVSDFLAAVYGRPADFRTVESLHGRTGGNPFFLEELLSAAGEVSLDELCSLPLPWSLAEVVRAQLDELDTRERRIVEGAAVLGRKVAFDLLATVTRTSEDELIDVLRELVHRGLMVETDDDVFSFRHALAREAIQGELLGRERRRLHQAALEALREAGSTDMAAIARHAQGAARYDDMVLAAREGARRYLAMGSTYQALDLAELGLTEADDDLVLLGVAARAAWLAGLIDDAVDHAEHGLEVARHVGDVVSESSALRLIVRLRWELGESDGHLAAADDVKAVIERLGPVDGLDDTEATARAAERGQAMAAVAQAYMLEGQRSQAVEWADQAAAVADELDLPALRVAALVEKGSAWTGMPAQVADGVQLLLDVAAEAERIGEHVIESRALHNVVRSELTGVDITASRALLERMRLAGERAGFDSMAGTSYAAGMADVAEWEGDIQMALDHLAEGRRRDRTGACARTASSFAAMDAGLSLEVGDIDRADAIVAEVGPRFGKHAVWYRGVVFHVAARRGDVAAARHALGLLLTAIDAGGGVPPRLVHDVLSAALTAGLTPAELEPLVDRITLDVHEPLPSDSPWRALVRAQLLEAQGDHAAALDAYRQAGAADATVLPAAALATANVGAARCLIAEGHLEEARSAAAAADVLLARWRGWRRDELDAVLRRLGVGDAVHGPAALTPREREVVALLGEGLSNVELAQRLYISRKTAAVHVSNILAKLGMSSRAEVAAFAAREGITV